MILAWPFFKHNSFLSVMPAESEATRGNILIFQMSEMKSWHVIIKERFRRRLERELAKGEVLNAMIACTCYLYLSVFWGFFF